MSFVEVTAAVSKVVVDTRLDMVEKIHSYLKEKLELDESDMNSLIEEFKGTLDLTVATVKGKGKKAKLVGEVKPKKKRAAGPYNKFLGEKIAEFKEASGDVKGKGTDYMAMAQKAWKELKEKYPEHEKNSAKLYELYRKDKGLSTEESAEDEE